MAVHQILFIALLIGGCAYAGVRGGSPERIVAATFLLAGPATRVVTQMPDWHGYSAVELKVLSIDGVMFVILTAIALGSARFWPMPMASMQGAELFAHFAKPLGSDVVPDAYYAIVAFWSYPMIALLVIATIRHRRRLARYRIDHAWAAALPPAYRAGGNADER